MGHGTNCPNCGAPIDPDQTRCAYCGTTYVDVTALRINAANWIRINVGTDERPQILEMRAYVSSCSLALESVYGHVGRDITGRMIREHRDIRKVKLELVEY